MKLNPLSIHFEHWYFNTLDSINPNLSFYNYTAGELNFKENSNNSTVVTPYLGYDFYKGIGLAAGVSYSNQIIAPSLGIQYSKGTPNFTIYSIISYTPMPNRQIEAFFWYFYQPVKRGFRPFFQISASSSFWNLNSSAQINLSLGPSYGSHAFGLVFDTSWSKEDTSIYTPGLFYRFQLQ